MTYREAINKIDNTVCLNPNIQCNIDKLDNCDCYDTSELFNCLEKLWDAIEILDDIKVLLKQVLKDNNYIMPLAAMTRIERWLQSNE